MTRLEQLHRLNALLLDDMPSFRRLAEHVQPTPEAQWRLFRSLVNLREPRSIGREFLDLQDDLLQSLLAEKGITDAAAIPPTTASLCLWQGDITTLRADAIVNAANSGLTGCYHPLHGCIDNAIHTFAGVQLRLECAALMKRQGHPEPTGRCQITRGYNLPCRYVLHTVGPVVAERETADDEEQLASCYRSCLELAARHDLRSLAFCCISTGEFHFPHESAARIAVQTVSAFVSFHPQIRVIFNVFQDEDYRIYASLLNP